MNANTTQDALARTMNSAVTALVVALALATGSLVTGCIGTDTEPPIIIGEWEPDETVCGENSWIEMDDDLSGEARIFFYYDGDCFYQDYDVEVDDIDGDEYEIEFKAEDRSLASMLDFDMDCEIEDDDEIECEGSDAFNDVEWVFEKD